MEITIIATIKSTTSRPSTPRRMGEILKYGIEHIQTDASIAVLDWKLESFDPEKK